jgi:anti-sigma regulatory factor (Ser/Thr protein kinase)
MEPTTIQLWAQAHDGSLPLEEVYCQTRDVVQSRVESLRTDLSRAGWGEAQTALITAVIGELTSNAFDHNLGKWRDVPGCWFEYNIGSDQLEVTIADRGQGVKSSLERIRPGIDEAQALQIAFAEHVTGRAPEKRGNGLKFVMNAIKGLGEAQFYFYSGNAMLSYSSPENGRSEIIDLISKSPVSVLGVYTRLQINRPL